MKTTKGHLTQGQRLNHPVKSGMSEQRKRVEREKRERKNPPKIELGWVRKC